MTVATEGIEALLGPVTHLTTAGGSLTDAPREVGGGRLVAVFADVDVLRLVQGS